MSVMIMICYARSGGTVLNQCLGCLPEVVILSEVNPLGAGSGKGDIGASTVKAQAKNWYDIDVSTSDFTQAIVELDGHCRKTGKHLIIRDWSFINFVPNPHNDFAPPRKLLTLTCLQDRCETVPFAFVRDAIDVWLSVRGPAKEFFGHYLSYVREIVKRRVRIFKYEDFCRKPAEVIQNICSYGGIRYSDSFCDYLSFVKVNGDVQVRGGSRGSIRRKIEPLPRKIISRSKIRELNGCDEMIECNSILGYPVSYYAVPRETVFKTILVAIRRRIAGRFLLSSTRLSSRRISLN